MPCPLNRQDNHGRVGTARMPYPPTISPKNMFFCSLVSQKNMFSCSSVFQNMYLLSNVTCVVRFGDRTSYRYRKQRVLGKAQPNLMFSCSLVLIITCSSVLLSFKKTCSHVLMSLKKNMSLCSSVFKHPFSCLHNKKDGSEQVLPIPNRLSTN